MEPDPEMCENLKQHHGFRSWGGRNKLRESLFVRNYFLSNRLIPDWEIEKAEELEVEGMPRCIRSFWHSAGEGSESRVRLDVYECESRAAAHEFLIQILGLFQSPLVGRRDDLQFGDVAFAPPGGANAVFARANMVFVVSRAGRKEFPVTELAARLDQDLISKPAQSAKKLSAAGGGPEITMSLAADSSGLKTPLVVEMKKSVAQPVYWKFFSSSGEVESEQGELVYKSASAGQPVITAYAVDHEGPVAIRTLVPAKDK